MLAQYDRCENMNCLCGKRPWRKPKPSRRSKLCGDKDNTSADISTHNMLIFCDKFALWIFGFRLDAPTVAWRITHNIPNWHAHVMQMSHKSCSWLHTAKDYSGLTKGMRLHVEAGGPTGQKMMHQQKMIISILGSFRAQLFPAFLDCRWTWFLTAS